MVSICITFLVMVGICAVTYIICVFTQKYIETERDIWKIRLEQTKAQTAKKDL